MTRSTSPPRRVHRALLLAGLATAALLALPVPVPAQAQTFPTKPVKILVGFPAGGPLDAHARLLADKLAALGLSLGADVPVFIHGHTAWAEGTGEILTPVSLPEAWYVLVDPGIHVPTAALFQAPDLTRHAAPAKIADFISGNLFGNAFEPVLRQREPAIDAVFASLSRIGTPRLTGSGSGCFVEFSSRASAEAALADLPDGLRAWVAAGVDCSPLQVLLKEKS